MPPIQPPSRIDSLRDGISKEHEALYAKYSHPEAPASLPPEELLRFSLLTERVMHFFARNLRAAPLYEVSGSEIGSESTQLDIRMLCEVFGRHYGPDQLPSLAHKTTIEEFHDGNQMDLYTKSVIAARREVDPVTESIEHCLVAHILHENTNEATKAELRARKPMTLQDLIDIMTHTSPAYILLEGRKVTEPIGKNADSKTWLKVPVIQ